MMRIGILGGTGGMGRGFAIRWCKNHEILIGSRDHARASAAATEYEGVARGAYGTIRGIRGGTNEDVAKECDVIVLSIPYGNIDAVCPVLENMGDGCIVVSPIVPMVKTDVGFEFLPISEGVPTAHDMVSKYADSARVVSAFHVISEKKLADPARKLDYDIFVCGDDMGAIGVVSDLVGEIGGLRPIYLGPGKLAYMAEMATPLLLNAMIRNKMKNPGFKLV